MNLEDQDNILEMAKELGYAIQQDQRFASYIQAKEKNDTDEELQKLIEDFSVVRTKLNAESMKEQRDDDIINSLDKEVTDMYQKIMANKNMHAYSVAKSEMDELVRIISTIVELSANGMDPQAAVASGCSPSDCAGCAGC